MKFRIIEQNGKYVPQHFTKGYYRDSFSWQNLFVGSRNFNKSIKFDSEALAKQFINLIKNQAVAEKKKKEIKIVYSE